VFFITPEFRFTFVLRLSCGKSNIMEMSLNSTQPFVAFTFVLDILELNGSSTSVRPGRRMNRRCKSTRRDRKRGIIVRVAGITFSNRRPSS